MRIPVLIDRTVETHALIDSGAGGTFIDEQFARSHSLALTQLINPIPVYNVDGTLNKQGVISHYAWKEVTIDEYTKKLSFMGNNSASTCYAK